jgi:hypothetical protein
MTQMWSYNLQLSIVPVKKCALKRLMLQQEYCMGSLSNDYMYLTFATLRA